MGLLTRLATKTTIALPLLMFSAISHAHFFAESPNNCKAPKKPLKFVTELDQQIFKQQVDEYRGCLEKFVTRQNDAMDKHKAGAEKAASAWKDYAEGVLNLKLKDANVESEAPAEAKAESAADTETSQAVETSQ